MKKALIIILTISCIFTTGCAKSYNTSNISEQNSCASSLEASPQVDLNSNKTDTTNSKSIVTGEESIDNSFFFKSNVLQLNYKGVFLFNTVLEKDVKLNINEVANIKYGKLYELKIASIYGVPNDRLDLGYFYVQKDKIYKIKPTEENLNKLKTSTDLPNDSVIVCQDKEIKDTLSKDETGWHQYMIVNGDTREYHSYNNKISTGYYESLTWEKNKGLIKYRSGYGAERDLIELNLSNN